MPRIKRQSVEDALEAEREFQEGPGGDGAVPPARVPEEEVAAQQVRDEVYAMKDEAYVPPRIDPPKYDPKQKPVRTIQVKGQAVPWMSGFCQGEAQVVGVLEKQMGGESRERLHSRCAGAFTYGNGTTILCGCPGHDGENRCSVCGHANNPEEFDPDRRRCIDVEDCADRLHAAATARANTPEARMIREVKATHGRDQVAVSTGSPRGASTRRVGRPCQCGCGLVTGGGLFRPGHDAKLKSALQKAAGNGDGLAATELAARGWPVPVTNTGKIERLDGPEAAAAYIDARVAERYAANGEQQGEQQGGAV